MALLNYKVNDPIQVIFQAAGAATGIVVTLNVYDEAGILDVVQSGVMAEIGTTGRYKKSFTPDANGEWSVQIADANGGKAVASYSVGNYNVDTVGALVSTVDAKADLAAAAIDAVASDIATVDGKIVDLAAALAVVDAKLASIQAPPMIG
jgi:hypothetical protein